MIEIPSSSHQADPLSIVSFLAWLDALEKIDTMIVEIRHIQINIIHALREPCLYKPLRYEEPNLWIGVLEGKDPGTAFWDDILKQPSFDQRSLRQAAYRAIIRFPPYSGRFADHNSADSAAQSPNEEFENIVQKDITRELRDTIEQIRNSGAWTEAERRYYHMLCASQVMKNNILYEKIALCWWGAKAFEFSCSKPLPRNDESRQRIGEFMLARAGVMKNIRGIRWSSWSPAIAIRKVTGFRCPGQSAPDSWTSPRAGNLYNILIGPRARSHR